jgi:heterodisulfide reductase subunit A-like polyferredoxin
MVELGIANVVARSAFVNRVDEEKCLACGECLSKCAFDALTLDLTIRVNETRCAGCGVCVPACQQNALGLVRRPGEELPPATEAEWRAARLAAN